MQYLFWGASYKRFALLTGASVAHLVSELGCWLDCGGGTQFCPFAYPHTVSGPLPVSYLVERLLCGLNGRT